MHRWCPQGPWHPSSDGWWSWAEQHLRCPRHRWRGFAESQRWAHAWFAQPTSCLSAALEKSPSTLLKVPGIFVKKRFYLFRSCSSSETAGVGNQSPSHHAEKQHQRQRGSKQPGVDLVFYLYSLSFVLCELSVVRLLQEDVVKITEKCSLSSPASSSPGTTPMRTPEDLKSNILKAQAEAAAVMVREATHSSN